MRVYINITVFIGNLMLTKDDLTLFMIRKGKLNHDDKKFYLQNNQNIFVQIFVTSHIESRYKCYHIKLTWMLSQFPI